MSISRDALKEEIHTWERVGPISRGGTVFGLAVSPIPQSSRVWAATGCGIFVSDDAGASWQQRLEGLTTPLLSALAVAPNGALFAGALGGDLFASFNFGRTWNAGRVPSELKAPVTVVLASPNFGKDGSAFAATDGGGLAVTRNSGDTWEDSSFGLGDASVLALAAPSDWSERETMFAATTEGVFVSRNGGRAWRETELMIDDDVVDVLAVSPDFEADKTVFAGTEGGSLYYSENGGRTWELVHSQIGDGPVNCLWLAPDYASSGRLVAGVGSRIYVSTDRGELFQQTKDLPGAILAVAGDDKVLLAGLHDAGIWKSTDGGASWCASSGGLSARGFARLVASGQRLYAVGPQEGLWMSESEGKEWSNLASLAPYLPITAFSATSEGSLFVTSQEHGILRSIDQGNSWESVCSAQGMQAIVLTPGDHRGLAGTMDGKLFSTHDDGATWESAESPCEGQEILSVVASTTYGEDHTLFMGTSTAVAGTREARVALWRSTNGGVSWRQVTTQVTSARWLDIAMPIGVTEKAAEQAVLATGPYCLRPLRRAKDVWISTQVDPAGANTLAVVSLGEIDGEGLIFAATGSGVFRSIDGGRTWHPFHEGLGSESIISIMASRRDDEDTLYALSLGGILWKRKLS